MACQGVKKVVSTFPWVCAQPSTNAPPSNQADSTAMTQSNQRGSTTASRRCVGASRIVSPSCGDDALGIEPAVPVVFPRRHHALQALDTSVEVVIDALHTAQGYTA